MERRIEERIGKVEERARKVEADKAWEPGKTARFIVAVFTHMAIGAYLLATGTLNALLNAAAPTIDLVLFALTLPYFKNLGIDKVYKGHRHASVGHRE